MENKEPKKFEFNKKWLIVFIIAFVLIIVCVCVIVAIQNAGGSGGCIDGKTCPIHFISFLE